MQRDARRALLRWLKSSNVGAFQLFRLGGNAERQHDPTKAPAAEQAEAERTRACEAAQPCAVKSAQPVPASLKALRHEKSCLTICSVNYRIVGARADSGRKNAFPPASR